MSSKLKIFQYHNVHLYNLKQYRIALEVGVYNSREGFLSVLGSNQRLAWEFKKWLPIHKEDFIPYSMNYRYGHVIVVLKAIRLLSNVYHVKTIKLNELQNSDKYVSFENIFLDCELSSPYAHGCQTDITHYFDSLSLMHDIQILLKRSCFLVEPSKTATFSDLVKVVGKRIKNEKHKFGVLYENGKLESHWLTNEEINNKTR